MERSLTIKNGRDEITFYDLDSDNEMGIESPTVIFGLKSALAYLTLENIESLRDHCDYLLSKPTSTKKT